MLVLMIGDDSEWEEPEEVPVVQLIKWKQIQINSVEETNVEVLNSHLKC